MNLHCITIFYFTNIHILNIFSLIHTFDTLQICQMCILQIHCMSCSSASPPNSKQKPSLQGPFQILFAVFSQFTHLESCLLVILVFCKSLLTNFPVQPPQFDFFLQAWSFKIKTPMFQHFSDLLSAVTGCKACLPLGICAFHHFCLFI